eukprot:jgi/Mesen1/5121/ME000255S04099
MVLHRVKNLNWLRQILEFVMQPKQHLWTTLPLFIIFLYVTQKKPKALPMWDTGQLDHVDIELFRKAAEVRPVQGEVRTSKIAFLFMTRGPMPLEKLWARFFQGHEDKYSVYIHASTPGFDCDSVINETCFRGRQIPGVPIYWGGPNMIRAERRLFAAALADPANDRFVLLSESCLPIHNFTHIYSYLFAANMSYIMSQPSVWRYKEELAPLVNKDNFMKGSQWVVLIRDHALMLVNDRLFYNKFLMSKTQMLDPARVAPRGVLYVHWKYLTSRHPMTYNATHDLTPQLLKAIQESRLPPQENTGFLQLSHAKPCTLNGSTHPCYLFARKFGKEALQSIANMRDVIGY